MYFFCILNIFLLYYIYMNEASSYELICTVSTFSGHLQLSSSSTRMYTHHVNLGGGGINHERFLSAYIVVIVILSDFVLTN